MDIINAAEVLRQLKRRLAEKKIHTLIWNSLIIVNPFKLIADQYG
jgi:myosin heavy subunit